MAKKKEDNTGDFRKALKNHKIPILTLDVRWYSLFPEHEKTSKMKSLEKELNNLLKKQGKLSTDNKEMKKLKIRLMKEIVENMEAAEEGKGTRLQEKKVDSSQKLILEINEKMKDADSELLTLPNEIQRVNQELMLEGMQVCYDRIQESTERMQELSKEIKEIREKLQYKLLEKNDREMRIDRIYTYMHALLGAGVMEILDKQKGFTGIHRNIEDVEMLPVNTPVVSGEGEDEDDDTPVGTGNRILKPRKGAKGEGSSDKGALRGTRTKAQERSEQEKKRLNLVRELENYDRQQDIKEKKTRKQRSMEAGVEEGAGLQTTNDDMDFMEERKRKLEERRAAMKKRKKS